jgi:hypothetical protein
VVVWCVDEGGDGVVDVRAVEAALQGSPGAAAVGQQVQFVDLGRWDAAAGFEPFPAEQVGERAGGELVAALGERAPPAAAPTPWRR